MKTTWKFLIGTIAVALVAAPASAGDHRPVWVLDVSMDSASTWSSTRGDLDHLAENRRGDTFLVRGSIYPGLTIPTGDNLFGPDEPGRVGTWMCRGVFNFDFDPEILGGAVPHVWTTQVFLLPRSFNPEGELESRTTLVTEGLEGGIPTRRAIQGGTGACAGARGDVIQEQLGFSSGGLFNHRFTFRFDYLPPRCRLPETQPSSAAGS